MRRELRVGDSGAVMDDNGLVLGHLQAVNGARVLVLYDAPAPPIATLGEAALDATRCHLRDMQLVAFGFLKGENRLADTDHERDLRRLAELEREVGGLRLVDQRLQQEQELAAALRAHLREVEAELEELRRPLAVETAAAEEALRRAEERARLEASTEVVGEVRMPSMRSRTAAAVTE